MEQELEVRVRPAVAGRRWIGAAWRLFSAQVGTWLVLAIILLAISALAGRMQLISLLMNLIFPVFIGGLMIGAHQQAGGGRVEIAHLLAGFSGRFVDLLLLGLIQLLASLVVMVVAVVGIMLTIGLGVFENPEGLGEISWLTWVLLALVLTVPMGAMIMAFWIAVPLVAVAGCKPWEAVERSFDAAWRNWRALLLYGLFVTLLLLVAMIPLGLGLIVLVPVLVLTGYTACADVFSLQGPAQPMPNIANEPPESTEEEHSDDGYRAD